MVFGMTAIQLFKHQASSVWKTTLYSFLQQTLFFSQSSRAANTLFLVITYKKTQIPCCTERIMMIRAYVHTQEKCAYKQIILHNQTFFSLLLYSTLQLIHIIFLTLQGPSLYPKAMRWVFLSRKSPCWAWYQTQQRYSAPYRAVFPC